MAVPFEEPPGFAYWSKKENVFDDPIILGGCGRSGTTLLRVLLNNHSELFCGPETQLCQPSKTTFLDRYLDFKVLSEWFDAPLSFFFDCYKASCDHSQARMVSMIMGNLCMKADATRWCDKTPTNVRVLPWIFDHFQSAQFVHVIRDGRDVVCSLRHHPKWQRSENGELVPTHFVAPFEACVKRWVFDVTHGIGWREDPRYYEVRYEDLVLKTEETLKALCAWLKLEWDPGMLRKERDPSVLKECMPEPLEPIHHKSIGRWRTDLNTEEREYFRKHAGPVLVGLGYAQPSYL